ncbi:phosphotransferase family protein [Streptomyces sp. NPDC059255]|uniref:phosphotransferase family protein n=1 Tax=Streptomyces sp. NPDC059255 TaxID=3346793 RepID=UPI003687AE73
MASRLEFGESVWAELGRPVGARRLESSPRSRVWRVGLAGGSAVVKQVVEGPDADERYAREVTALRLAARVDPPVVPAVLGADPGERVLVLEDLEHLRPPRDWVVAYAGGLARLHAATGPGDAGVLPRWAGPTRGDVASFLALAESLSVPVAQEVPGELDALVARLGSLPGGALLHGDPCPGNDLHTAEGVRFIDFEQASLGSGLVELAYLRIGFPTCWCATEASAPLLERAEAEYRSVWRAETGREPEGDVVDACVGWLLRGDALVERAFRGTADHLARVPDEDWTWGTATARQRLVHRLGVVGRVASGRPGLGTVSRLSLDLRARMRELWPGVRPLPSRRPAG